MGGKLVAVDPKHRLRNLLGLPQRAAEPCKRLTAIGVTRDGGFAEYVVVPEGQAFALPAHLDPVHGAFSEPLACSARDRQGGDTSRCQCGHFGWRVIGLLMVQLSKLEGAAKVILSTRQSSRRQMALELGATQPLYPSASDTVTAVRYASGGGADVVIECAGVPETFRTGIAMTRRGGKLCFSAWRRQGVSVTPFDLLVNEVSIRPTYVNPFTRDRAVALVASGKLELDRLVTRIIGLYHVAEVIAFTPAANEVKVIVRPWCVLISI